MSFEPGARLGPYEILSAIGAGGMGQVYRARDTRLHRDVAIKVLPEAFAADPERVARFQREAQVLASLNYSHIAQIYGIEEMATGKALILEFVDGPTLADRIQRGPIPLDEALSIAQQIAEALEVAHEQGIVHRDLKPANIKLTAAGTVKVLDFGLAKAVDASARRDFGDAGGIVSQSPTVTSPALATHAGLILGTAAYMSPEQAKGRTVDKRADIWAFGCVLYEMLTGTRAFDGEDVSEVLAAVIKSDPAWHGLPPTTTQRVRALLQRCLQKDPRQRLRDIGDARLELQEAQLPPPVDGDAIASKSHRTRERLAWALAAMLLVVLIAALAFGAAQYVNPRVTDARQPLRFFVAPPDGWTLKNTLSNLGGSSGPLIVSPDGSRVAFVATDVNGRDEIWIRSLDTLAAQRLTGTEGASSPFWSPDSRFLGFFADGKLKKINLSGGPPLTLCDAPNPRGGTWSRDGIIVFAPTNNGGLEKVSAAGGAPTAATILASGDVRHLRPSFLPDGRRYLYSATGAGGPVYVASLDSADRTVLLKSTDSTNVLYAQNHLLFLREQTLMAQPFDLDRVELTGEAIPIAEQINTQSNFVVGVFSASENGVLVYQTGEGGENTRLLWLDRLGKQIGALGDQASYRGIELSPDNKRLAVVVLDSARGTGDIWLYDVIRGLRTRFTFDPAADLNPTWSPDGSRIVFDSDRNGSPDLYMKASTGAGSEELLLREDGIQRAHSWSHDGENIVYQSSNRAASPELFSLPVRGPLKPAEILKISGAGFRARLSPDDRWVAYTSVESGRNEVYVAPFPKADAKWQVSIAGGSWSRWRQDGREIFYMSPSGILMAAAVDAKQGTFEIGEVRPLFHPNVIQASYMYDVSSDGQRILVATHIAESAPAPITVVVNWTADLKK